MSVIYSPHRAELARFKLSPQNLPQSEALNLNSAAIVPKTPADNSVRKQLAKRLYW